MNSFQTIIGLMTCAVLLVGVAQRWRIPYPIALVLGGAVLSFVPGLQPVNFNPNLILIVVLPPILYYGAFWTPFREFKQNFSDIAWLALGLVALTTLIIGILTKWLFPDIAWPLAFAFGAIISPPDAASATAILKRYNIRSRLLTILEGESLVNDASALILYRLTVFALLSGTFSLPDAILQFIWIVAGGVVVGILSGYLLQEFSGRILSPVVGVLFSFVIPYITYISADLIGVSGVLAVVVNGLIGSHIIIKHNSSLRRVVAYAAWDVFIIFINCFVFILIGLHLSVITRNMTVQQIVSYSAYGFLFSVILVIIRMGWVFARESIAYKRASHEPNRVPECQRIYNDAFIIGWSGMRGIVSLTAVLALPFTLVDGTPVAYRDLVVFLTFVVILLTLVVPGLTLPTLIEWLKIHHGSDTLAKASEARSHLMKIAIEEIEHLSHQGHLDEEDGAFLQSYFSARRRIGEIMAPTETHHKLDIIRRKVLQAQRNALLQMWEDGEINDRLLTRLEYELDVEESHFARAEIR